MNQSKRHSYFYVVLKIIQTKRKKKVNDKKKCYKTYPYLEKKVYHIKKSFISLKNLLGGYTIISFLYLENSSSICNVTTRTREKNKEGGCIYNKGGFWILYICICMYIRMGYVMFKIKSGKKKL